MDVPYLSVAIAEDPETSTRGAEDDYQECIQDLEGIQTVDGQITCPVRVAEGISDTEPISVEEYIEAQAADPWC